MNHIVASLIHSAMPSTTYLYDDDTLLAEFEGGALSTRYTYEPQQYGNLISDQTGANCSQYHYDAIGSTVDVTNDQQQLLDSTRYSAFGQEAAVMPKPFAFCGRVGYYHDVELDAFYVRRRYYLDSLARWLSIDSAGFVDGLNLFLYAMNDPITQIDPSGNAVSCEAKCIKPIGKGDGVVAVRRSGSIQASISNSSSERKNKGIASQMSLFYSLAGKEWKAEWHETMGKVPAKYGDCCCCCTDIEWAQVVVEDAEGPAKVLKSLSGASLGKAFVDVGLPYPNSVGFNPCKVSRQASMSDTPKWGAIQTFFRKGGTSWSQSFSACVYCAEGPEALKAPFMATYCCIDWGHRVFQDTATKKLKVTRWINDKLETWDFDGEDWSPDNQGGRLISDTFPCRLPSVAFAQAVESGSTFSRKK